MRPIGFALAAGPLLAAASADEVHLERRQDLIGGILSGLLGGGNNGDATSNNASPTSGASGPGSNSPSSSPSSAPSSAPSSSSSSSSVRDSSSRSVDVVTSTSVFTPPLTFTTIGTSTSIITLPPVTSVLTRPSNASANRGSSGLSSGAKAGIIAGSVVGGIAVLALLVVAFCAFSRKRKHTQEEQDNIKWPEVATSAADRAALYPESTRPTGRAGLGDMEEYDGDELGPSIAAGAAGIGAARYHPDVSRSHSGVSRGPTLPSFPPSVYDEVHDSPSLGPYGGFGGSPAQSTQAYSTQSHAPLGGVYPAPGPASVAYHRPSTAGSGSPHEDAYGGGFSESHGGEYDVGPHQAGAEQGLPLPGSELGHGPNEIGRAASPHEMQVGDGPYGHGYEEGPDGGRAWRLSITNANV